MSPRRWSQAPCIPCTLAPLALALWGAVGCSQHPMAPVSPGSVQEASRSFPQSLDKQVDILFVIDNSQSMAVLQGQLARQFPRLIDALRTPKLKNDIPDVRIGVVSTDLGAGPYTIQGDKSACVPGGDGGKLQRQARVDGCTLPDNDWIAYEGGKSNVSAGDADPVARVKEAFSCIARLGDHGCGFESVLQSARLALDPNEHRNPGFLRPNALLAIVFITNEDDCSARNTSLFDTSSASLERLGPLQSFRCFEFGFRCDINERKAVGPRKNCLPTTEYLYDVDEYARFFRGLKPEGRVLVTVVAGDTSPIMVVNDAGYPALQASCVGTPAPGESAPHGDPALRMKALADAFGSNGQFTSICAADFGPSLQKLGERIVGRLGQQCLEAAPLTALGELACNDGDALGAPGARVTCSGDRLAQADCLVAESSGTGQPPRVVPRCPAELFQERAPSVSATCWRLVPRADCKDLVAPYAMEILRAPGKAVEPGTFAQVNCAAAGDQDLIGRPGSR